MENYDYRVVVGIDFGITHSGFAYAHKRIKTVIVHSEWQEYYGLYKIPTVLLYDDKYDKVQSWGFNALKESNGDKKPIELFKLHLGNITNKPSLPNGFDYKKAIIDYLHEMGKIIKQVIINDWIDFYNHVLIVLTVPVEFDHTSIAIMRECAFKAGLLKDRYSRNLKFITEPEATMIHCMKSLNENLSVGETFMIVDCKGDTVNSTTIQLLEGERLNIMTERERNDCGDNFIDQEFLKFLERKVGSSTIKLIKENQYNQFQYMLKEFYRKVKMEFTGIQSEFRPINLELDELCPALIQYCDEKYFDNMKKIEWNIKLKFDDIKSMFDPIIEKILKLIERSNHNCTALLLIGILSESKYFQLRINQEFNNKIPIIYIPPNPITSIMEGDLDCNGDSTLECVAPYTNNMRLQLTQSYDTIKNLEKEKNKLQNEIQESNKNLNKYRSLCDNLKKEHDELVNKNDEYKEQEQYLNDMWTQSSDTIKKLEEEKKKFQEEIQKYDNKLNEFRSLYDGLKKKYDGLVNENDEYKEQEQRLNDMQFQSSDTIKKLEEEKEKFQGEIQKSINNLNEYRSLYDNLMKKYDGLVNENDEYKEKEQRLNELQIQSSNIIKKLEEEKKKLQDEIQELASENKEKEQRLNDMQIQTSDTIKKLEEEKEKFQDEIRELVNENKEQEQHFNNTWIQSSDTIIKLEEEKEQLQDEIQELVNENKEQEQRLNDTQNQSSDTIKKLEEEKKKLQDEIQELANENKEKEHHLNDMQIQTSDTIKKLEEEKEKFQDEIRELINENKEKEQHFNNTRIQSSDTIIKLEEEKEKLQDEIQELINENKEQEQRLNDTQNQSSDTIKKLEEEKKKLQDEIQELVNENKDLNDMQIQSSDTIEKLEEEKKKLQDDIQEYDNDSNKYKSSYNNLQEKYNELTNKNNEETNQNQKLKNEINQINDINQQYIEKIDQLQQSLQNLEKEKEELDAKNYNLYYQLERLVQQNELKNELLLDDDCQNHALKLNDDILGLNDNIKIYITDLKQDVTVNMEEIKKLLLLYECPTKITNQDDDRLLIQAVLQRHIIETIFLFATKYFQTTEQCYHLESDIINKTSSLYNLLNKISKQRAGNEEVSHVASIKLRQQIYSILNNHGFCDIIGDGIYEHPFIVHHKEQLNKIMNELRIIEDDQEKIASENLAATIIREFVRIFWFRLIVQEPVVQYAWIPHNAKMDKTLMEGTNLDDNENLHVDLCYFPLTGRDLASKNRKIYTPAKVFTRKD
ncbi:hypothetical protein RclHR1_03200018 [Rhizophagus clarus]|uniref:Hsp70 family protein n=1 Tax=Rhizophagus clarus TaxID=94130 RepID=A0A2Z6S2X0_9GLOM|nr:hypothetical protein RclHR1_03200018 [Rhizophagus clarus]